MTDIDKINDKFFKKTFTNPGNVKTFLKIALPDTIKKRIDFSSIEIDPTDYISEEFKEYFSDVVVKTSMRSKENDTLPADIYFILEHKTRGDRRLFIQVLKYMLLEWQSDIKQNDSLRLIIPLVFYHGEEEWRVPHCFVDQFEVDEELKLFLLNYRYILFDTKEWDFREDINDELRDNVFLLTLLVLMKCAYNRDLDAIGRIFRFWQESGISRDVDQMLFYLMYITETGDIPAERLKEMLEESKIPGGDIMPTLAQRWIDEGMKKGMQQGKKQGKLETAQNMIENGINIDVIVRYTGLSRKEIEKLTKKIH